MMHSIQNYKIQELKNKLEAEQVYKSKRLEVSAQALQGLLSNLDASKSLSDELDCSLESLAIAFADELLTMLGEKPNWIKS